MCDFRHQFIVGVRILNFALVQASLQLLGPEVRKTVRTFFLPVLLQEVLLFEPFLQLVLTLQVGTHPRWLVQPGRCLFIKLDPVLDALINLLELVNLLLQLMTVRLLGTV